MLNISFDTDQQILEHLAKSDVRAFDFIYQKYFQKLYGVAYKRLQNHELTEEVIQELFISLWERRGRMPKSGDRLLRPIYLEQTEGNVKIMEMIDCLNGPDLDTSENFMFREYRGHWKEAA